MIPLEMELGFSDPSLLAVVIFCIGVIVQTSAMGPSSIYGGRFVTGWGVGASNGTFCCIFIYLFTSIGSLSMAVPLYNAELAPPEIRGSLVGLQQLSIAAGIMVSYWIDYGTNFIGGTGESQGEAAWRLPLALQLVPAVVLGVGVWFMPFSPRCVVVWHINYGSSQT